MWAATPSITILGDKYDLVNWYFQSGITRFLVELSAYSSWNALLAALETYFLENKVFYCNALAYNGQNSLQQYMFDYLRSIFEQNVRELTPDASAEETRKIGQFFAGAMMGILIPWVLSGMKSNALSNMSELSIRCSTTRSCRSCCAAIRNKRNNKPTPYPIIASVRGRFIAILCGTCLPRRDRLPDTGRWRSVRRGGGPKGRRERDFAITRRISSWRKVLSPPAAAGAPRRGAKVNPTAKGRCCPPAGRYRRSYTRNTVVQIAHIAVPVEQQHGLAGLKASVHDAAAQAPGGFVRCAGLAGTHAAKRLLRHALEPVVLHDLARGLVIYENRQCIEHLLGFQAAGGAADLGVSSGVCSSGMTTRLRHAASVLTQSSVSADGSASRPKALCGLALASSTTCAGSVSVASSSQTKLPCPAAFGHQLAQALVAAAGRRDPGNGLTFEVSLLFSSLAP